MQKKILWKELSIAMVAAVLVMTCVVSALLGTFAVVIRQPLPRPPEDTSTTSTMMGEQSTPVVQPTSQLTSQPTPWVVMVTATLPSTSIPTQQPPVQDYPRVNNHPRECLQINGNRTCVPIDEALGMWAPQHAVTGYNQGTNYRSEIPAGWAVAYAAASCAVHMNGASAQTEYADAPFIVIIGPWYGSVGCWSGGVHGVPVEWIGFLLETILPVHRAEAGNYAIQPTFIGKIPPTWSNFVPTEIVTKFEVP